MAERSFQKITGFLDSVIRARLRVRRSEAGMVLALGLLSVLLLAPAAVVSQARFGYSAVIYLGLTILLLGLTAARAWWLTARRPKRESVALDIEKSHPDLGSNLISSLQLFPRRGALGADDPTSPALIEALVHDTAREVESLDSDAYVSPAAFQRLGRIASVLAVGAILLAFVWPGLYPRAGYLLANAADLMPSRITHLAIAASRTTVLPGMPVAFDVRTTGREVDSVELEVRGGASAPSAIALKKVAAHHFRGRWAGAGADARVTARAGRFHSRTLAIRVVAPPRVESVEVVQYPPEYTSLKSVRGRNGGHIRAYMGSEVRLAVKTNKPVKEALISLADGWRLPLKPVGNHLLLRGKMILGGAGSYQVRLKDAHGFSNLAPRRYQIDIIPDAYPEVAVTRPSGDLTVEADDRVAVAYRASDDFGLRSVHLEARLDGGRPRRIKMWSGETPRKSAKGRYEFGLRAMGVRPGGVISYRFIARDGDTVSGPKVGTSKTYRIRVRDREAVMAGLDRNLGEISNALLDLLGDYLEKDLPPETAEKGEKGGRAPRKTAAKGGALERKAKAILGRIQRARASLRPKNPRETLADMDLSTLERQLEDAISQYLRPLSKLSRLGADAKARRERERLGREMAARQEEATETLERLATMGEEIQRNVRVDRAGRTTESMIQRQRAVERALEKMRRQGADKEAVSRVERELEKLREELGKLMRQMASLAQRMPAEFMNQRSMREMPMRNMMEAFGRIRQMMRQNNFKGALEELRRLMSQLQRMRMALRGMQRQQMMSQRGGRPIQRRQSELASIVEEQQAILGETVGVLENVVDRLRQEWPKEVAQVARGARAAWRRSEEAARRPLPTDCPPGAAPKGAAPSAAAAPPVPQAAGEAEPSPRMRAEKMQRERMRALSEMDAMLKRGEWGIVFQRLPEWRAALGASPCVRAAPGGEGDADAPQAPGSAEDAAPWTRVAEALGRLLEKSENRSGGTEIAKLEGLRFRQESLRRRLGSFERRLRQMMQVYPFINPGILRRIAEAGELMEGAAAFLKKRSSSRAVPAEEGAIRKLAQGQNSMQQAMRQMAQRGSVGMGTPRGFGILRQGMGGGRPWWSRNPDFPREGGNQRDQQEDGSLGTQFSEVLIPDREQYKVPAKFREEIMEAMKDGLPDAMRGEIENYFDRLTK